jgi:hypothetical protein
MQTAETSGCGKYSPWATSQSPVYAVPPYVDNLMACVIASLSNCSSMALLQSGGMKAISTLFCERGQQP